MSPGSGQSSRSEIEPGSLDGERVRGDVYVGSMAAGTRRIPGSSTAKGRTAIVDLMHDAVDRVRRRVNNRR